MKDDVAVRNILDSAAEHLPTTQHLADIKGPSDSEHDVVRLYAVPAGHKLERVDTEQLLPNPRRMKASAVADELATFVAYIQRHADERTAVWVQLDPATNALSLRAQMDEHAPNEPSWREHRITFTPRLSVEWQRWMEINKQPQGQAEFALWIEDNSADIATVEGRPTSGDMLQMALQFEARQDMRLKSHIRLQNGGVQLEYVGDDDDATIQRMQMFDRFAIGIPVFWSGSHYRVDARLRYRTREGKVTFWYELIRPDRVHEAAATDLITQLRAAIGDVPVYMGAL